MAHIEYYLSTLSPWCYLAGNRLERIAAQHGATITYCPLDLIALFARTGGVKPADRHRSRLDYRKQELARHSALQGLPLTLNPAHWPTNPAPSCYAIIAAQSAGGGDLGGLVHALLRACWAEERDVARDEVIRDCLTSAGFDAGLADSGLLAGAETYGANLERAVEQGVFGAPFYLVDSGQKFWGQDRLDHLEAHLAGKL